MHTTGLPAETMTGLYEGEGLAAALRDARAHTLAIYSHLDLASLAVPCIATVNPPLWELAHVAWFQEYWCLRGGDDSRASILPRSDALFNSSTVAHDSRWHLDYPSHQALRSYMEEALDATQAALARTPPEERYFFRLALRHEDMHAEALLMTLQALGLPAPPVEKHEPPRGQAGPVNDIAFAGGEFVQGSADSGFTFDNERGAHRVRVAPFAMASRPVSQGEFAAFVEAAGAPPPRYWKREGVTWMARRYDRWAPIDPHAAMVHVSLHEAEAYCRWAKRRLPTESEWEYAVRKDAGDGPARGLGAMLGGVWEWTSSPFAPYPGFAPDPYRDYSQPWFHSHFVLRGGSFATSGRIACERYRNFYLPERGDPFAGFRTCALEAP
jgi:iron(II)-dependent oxidoreductase